MTAIHTAADLAAGLMWLWKFLAAFGFACAAVWTVIRVNRWAREGVAGHVEMALDPEQETEKLRAELDNPAAVVLWLTRGV